VFTSSLVHCPLELYVNRNCQIGVHVHAPVQRGGGDVPQCPIDGDTIVTYFNLLFLFSFLWNSLWANCNNWHSLGHVKHVDDDDDDDDDDDFWRNWETGRIGVITPICRRLKTVLFRSSFDNWRSWLYCTVWLLSARDYWLSALLSFCLFSLV